MKQCDSHPLLSAYTQAIDSFGPFTAAWYAERRLADIAQLDTVVQKDVLNRTHPK